jgi:hypothetical protein
MIPFVPFLLIHRQRARRVQLTSEPFEFRLSDVFTHELSLNNVIENVRAEREIPKETMTEARKITILICNMRRAKVKVMKLFTDLRQYWNMNGTCSAIRVSDFLTDCTDVCPKFSRLLCKPGISLQDTASRSQSTKFLRPCTLPPVRLDLGAVHRSRIWRHMIVFDRYSWLLGLA